MIDWVTLLLILAALGSGLMAGLFCSFSTFIMNALASVSKPSGIAAMQAIVRPSFLLLFLGIGLVCVPALVLGWQDLSIAVFRWAIAGKCVISGRQHRRDHFFQRSAQRPTGSGLPGKRRRRPVLGLIPVTVDAMESPTIINNPGVNRLSDCSPLPVRTSYLTVYGFRP